MDIFFWTVAIATVVIVGLSKAGLLGSLGMVAVPLLSLLMPARDAAGVMLPILICMDAYAIWAYRRNVEWSILRIMLPGAMLGTAIGWALWSFVSDAVVLLLVGTITLVFILDTILPLRKKLEGLPLSRPWGRFWGAVSGFTSFVSHTGGPPFQVYVLPRRMPPERYAGTAAYFFAIVNFVKLPPYFLLGQLNTTNLALSAALAPIGVLGVVAGVWLVRRISVRHFYTIAYWLVFLLGLKLVWDGVTGLLA